VSVLVTDGNQRSTLAVVRALGRGGIPVTVGESRPSSLAGSSKHCSRRICYPSPGEEGERFLAFLRDEVRQGTYDLLIPMTDIAMQLISSERERLAPLVRLPFPVQAQVNLVQDKRYVLLAAREAGIACPETFLLHESETAETIAPRIHFPAVIKPRFSQYYREGKWISGPVRYARDAASLKAEYSRIHQLIPNPLVQERIEGEGRGVFLLVWNGELKAAFCHRRLREKPPWGGVSVFSESVSLNQNLVEKSYALLKVLGWQGVAMVEYKVDRRDGQPKLMEVNGRFWGSLQLAIDAGMNFPVLLYRLAMGEEVPPQFEYEVGIKNRWLLGDLDHLLMTWRPSHSTIGPQLSSPLRLKALLDFAKVYQRGLHYEVLRFDDPAPGWFEIKSYLGDIFRRPRHRRNEPDAS
jgi:predicted ATP-grasp superfamily ATP-dependent carboligase